MMRKMTLAAFMIVLLVAGRTTHAELLIFRADLSGPNEDPPNASPGTGSAGVIIDTLAHTMEVRANFQDLLDPTTVAHIHAPTVDPLTGLAGVATQVPTFSGFPAGVTEGVYQNLFDLTLESTYNPTFVTNNGGTAAGAEAALIAALLDKKAYWNIHTTGFPAGEIRGFLQQVPEPSSLSLLALGALLFGISARRLGARQKSV